MNTETCVYVDDKGYSIFKSEKGYQLNLRTGTKISPVDPNRWFTDLDGAKTQAKIEYFKTFYSDLAIKESDEFKRSSYQYIVEVLEGKHNMLKSYEDWKRFEAKGLLKEDEDKWWIKLLTYVKEEIGY